MQGPTRPSRARRLAGPLALGATAAYIAAQGIGAPFGLDWPILAFAALLGGGAAGLAHRSVASQVLSRGVAWLVFAPTLTVVLARFAGGDGLDAGAALVAAGSGAALWLASPMLETAEARAAFAPVAFRRWLLVAAALSAAAGLATGAVAVLGLASGHAVAGAGLAALALGSLASAVGVARMRAWGILLGAATSLASLAAALALGHAGGLGLALAAIPGALLAAPVVAARLGLAAPAPSSSAPALADVPYVARVASDTASARDDEPRVRVAAEAPGDEDDDARVLASDAAPAAARARG